MLSYDEKGAEKSAGCNSLRRPGADDKLLGVVCGWVGQYCYVSRALAALLIPGLDRSALERVHSSNRND